MTDSPSRISTGLRSLRDNPDVCALVALALALMVVHPAAAAKILSPGLNAPVLEQRRSGDFGPAGGEFAMPERPLALRVSPISRNWESDEPDLPLGEWAAKFEQKRERLWRRLDEQMRRLEQRVEMHENKIRTRAVSVREE